MANEERLIDSNKFMRETCFQEGIYPNSMMKKEIEAQPAVDAVEVVRCGVCRFVDTKECPMSGSAGRVSASDFCSYGERKGNG